MPEPIKCHVEDCHFNDSFLCMADSIEVRSSEDGKVCSSGETCCETFKPR